MQIEVDITELAKALKQVNSIIKVSKESHYPDLCLRFSTDKHFLEIAVADSYRFAVCSVEVSIFGALDKDAESNNYLVKPSELTRIVNKLARNRSLSKRLVIRFRSWQLSFSEPDKTEGQPLAQIAFMCGGFPRYQELLKRLYRENLTSYTFDRLNLLEQTNSPKLFEESEPNETDYRLRFEVENPAAIEAGAAVNFKVKAERAKENAAEKIEMQEVGASEITAIYSAVDNRANIRAIPVDRVAFSPALLKSFLEAIGTEQVALILSSYNQPVLIKPIGGDGSSVYALLPMFVADWNKKD